jgi:putative oxidoreductase
MTRTSAFASFQLSYGYLIFGATKLQSLFLLTIRLYWGWQFCSTGFGKLAHIDKITGFFHDLGIPFPMFNACLAGTTEFLGGICLMLGLASRLVAIPLIFTLIVAYATAERDVLKSIFTDPDMFTSADPFLFMLAAMIVLLFGPGKISIDALLKWVVGKDPNKPATDSLRRTPSA